MTTYSGRQVQLYGGIETTPGTAVTPKFTFNHDGAEFKRMIDEQMNENTYGRVDKYAGQQIIRQYAQGTIKGYADSDSLGLWLTLVNASSPTSTTSGAKHTHTYARANTALGTTATIYRQAGLATAPNYREAYTGARLSKFELEMNQDSWAKYSADLIARQAASSNTTLAQANPTTQPVFRPKDISVKLASDVAGLSGATSIKAKTAKLTYNSDLKGYGTINSLDFAELVSASFDVMVEITALFENTTYRELWINKTYQAVEIKMTGDRAKGTVTPVLTITIPSATIGSWQESTSLGDFVEETFTLNAHFNGTETFKCVLENDLAKTGNY